MIIRNLFSHRSSSGCDDNFVCCRVQNESPVSHAPVETSSEPTDVDPTTQKQAIDQQHCTCVPTNQCSDSGSQVKYDDFQTIPYILKLSTQNIQNFIVLPVCVDHNQTFSVPLALEIVATTKYVATRNI